MIELSKKHKKIIRELAGIAYEREQDFYLMELLKQFEAWRNKKISGFELNDLIHEFHHGISRELYNAYTLPNKLGAVFRAYQNGFLKKDEIPEDLVGIVCVRLATD